MSDNARLIKQPETASNEERNPAAHLEEYQWKKGCASPNPKGRPKSSLPLSDGLVSVMGMPVSQEVRKDLEAAVGKLPKNFSWNDAYSLAHVLDMFGKLKGFKLQTAREIRDAIEGKSTQRMQIVQEEDDYSDSDEIQKKLWTWFAETEVKRCNLFGLPLPADTAAKAKELGVDLSKVGEAELRLGEADRSGEKDPDQEPE